MRSHALGVSGAGGRRKSGLPGLEGAGRPAGKAASTLESHVHADAECFGWENSAQLSRSAWTPPHQKRK